MARCDCVVLIPNPQGGRNDYAVAAKSSREAARKALAEHPYTVPEDAVITVIAEGRRPMDAESTEHNARQPTFWHRAGTIDPVSPPDGKHWRN